MTDPQLERYPNLKAILERLIAAFQPERIYLFGSKARGDEGPDSDYDLMVIVSSSSEPPYKRSQRACLALHGIATAADVLVWTREAFDSRLHLKASFPSAIVREGRVLYAA